MQNLLARHQQCASRAPGKTLRRAVTDGRRVVRCAAGANGKHSTTFHKLIEEKGIVMLPGVYDALSAKILHSTGLETAFISGYAVSATLLGEPDLGLLTPPEMARKASQICNAVPTLHVIADADTGGGNVLNVQRTVKQLIAAGCKGIFMEDQQWPKRAGHMRNKEVISMEDFAVKVAAAREVIGDADFFLVARTDARGTSAKYGLEDAITRANLYHDAGADATFVEAPRTTEELREIGEKTKGLKVCNMLEGGVTPLHTPAELKELGFSLVVHPMSGLYAAKRALQKVYTQLGEAGTTRDSLDELADLAEFNKLVGYEERIQFEERLSHPQGDKLVVRVRAGVKPHEI